MISKATTNTSTTTTTATIHCHLPIMMVEIVLVIILLLANCHCRLLSLFPPLLRCFRNTSTTTSTTFFVVVVAAGAFEVSASSSSSDDVNEVGDNNIDDDYNDDIDFPPMLDSDDIRYYSENYDLDGLHWALRNVFKRSARNPNTDEVKYPQLPQSLISKGGGSSYTTKYKLEMDLEQAQYLVDKYLSVGVDVASSNDGNVDDDEGDEGEDDDDDDDDHTTTTTTTKSKLKQQQQQQQQQVVAYYLRDVVIPAYQNVLNRIPPLNELNRTNGLYAFRSKDIEQDKILDLYNKAFYHTDDFVDVMKDPTTTGQVVPLLNKQFDTNKIESKWFGTKNDENDDDDDDDNLSRPGVVVIDDILSPEALKRIHQIMLESQVFFQTKMPLKFGGYAGAYIDDGLHDKILLQLAFELSSKLPNIIGRKHPLKYLWAYKYDSEYKGISIHADQAAVNVNIWLTPTNASLDLDHGGLVVYTAKPPVGANFETYNTNVELAIKEILEPTKFANVTVPYRQNRAVIFDSALFHQTDKFKFRKGYKNRRINLTILYGEMQQQQKQEEEEDQQGQQERRINDEL